MEAEAFELKQAVAFNQDVKGVLDSWVRQEAAAREAEQSQLVSKVISAVKEKLTDAKFVCFFLLILTLLKQTSVLNQSIADLETVSLK